MEDFELTLFDRIEIIKTTNQKYDLENNAYISFSGGKDSTMLHYLIDMALPNNKIPRVFINTGIEYIDIVKFVKELAKDDDRFIMLKPTIAIKPMLEKYGFPFKSKQHSHNVAIYQTNNKHTITTLKYLGIKEGNNLIKCPKKLEYQFTNDFKIKLSDKCCYKLKKEPIKKWEKENNKTIAILGLRQNEGGQRLSHKDCVVFDNEKNLVKFKPLNPISDEFEDWFIKTHKIELCKLYNPPFNFKRTGCKGCPFSLHLKEDLQIMEQLLPAERKQCEMIWKSVYDEYRRLNYRLNEVEQFEFIFDDLEKESE